MDQKLSQALSQLTKIGDPREALAVLDAIESKRRDSEYICYWQPQGDEPQIFDAWDGWNGKILAVTGGNRSGKTESGAAITVAWALGKPFFAAEPAWEWVSKLPIPDPPNNIWVVGLDFNVIRDVIWGEKLIRGKEHSGFIPDEVAGLVEKISERDYQIYFKNGSIITCKSADSGREKFQGASVDLVWIDEEPEEDVYDECYQRTADCAGKILVTLTPLTDVASGIQKPWVYDLWLEMKGGSDDIRFVQLSTLNNPSVPEEEKTRLIKKWAGHYEERARLYGEFIRRVGLVYPMWDKRIHLVKPSSLPRAWRRIVSIDPAATGITAAVWGAIDPSSNLFIYKEYYQKDLVVSDHAKNILNRTAGEPIDLWLIDPKWGSQRAADTHKTNQQLYKDAGIPVRLAEVGEDFGLNASREYFQATTDSSSRNPKCWVFRDCYNFIDEIEHYSWDFFQRGPLKGMSKDKPQKGRDHLMNAFQYLCAQRPRPGRPTAYRPSEAERKAAAESNSYF